MAPAEQAAEGCLKFALLWIAAQTFGTPPAALARVHLPYNVGEALSFCKLSGASEAKPSAVGDEQGYPTPG